MVVDRTGHFPVTWRIEGERYLSRLARPEIRREQPLLNPAELQFHHQIVSSSTSVGHDGRDRLSEWRRDRCGGMVTAVRGLAALVPSAVVTMERSPSGASSAHATVRDATSAPEVNSIVRKTTCCRRSVPRSSSSGSGNRHERVRWTVRWRSPGGLLASSLSERLALGYRAPGGGAWSRGRARSR